jgi:ABC-type histidine transport system ATPase subunit
VSVSLEVRDLHVRLAGSHVLQGVSFEVPAGAVTAPAAGGAAAAPGSAAVSFASSAARR